MRLARPPLFIPIATGAALNAANVPVAAALLSAAAAAAAFTDHSALQR